MRCNLGRGSRMGSMQKVSILLGSNALYNTAGGTSAAGEVFNPYWVF